METKTPDYGTAFAELEAQAERLRATLSDTFPYATVRASLLGYPVNPGSLVIRVATIPRDEFAYGIIQNHEGTKTKPAEAAFVHYVPSSGTLELVSGPKFRKRSGLPAFRISEVLEKAFADDAKKKTPAQ